LTRPTQATRLLSPVSALVLMAMPVSIFGQARDSARNEAVLHWFAACASGDSLALEVRLDGKPLYSTGFPICHVRRADIKPEPQQRILKFRFDAQPRRFRNRFRANETLPIEGNIWEAGGDPDAILLGVSFSTEEDVLLNTIHVASAASPSRSELVRGLVITTRPLRIKGGGKP